AAGVDLRLPHPYLAAEFLRRAHRFFHAEAGHAAGCGDTVLPEDFFRLVFVDFHRRPLPESDPRRAGTPNCCVPAAYAGTVQGIACWKVAEQAGPRESAGSIPQRTAPQ